MFFKRLNLILAYQKYYSVMIDNQLIEIGENEGKKEYIDILGQIFLNPIYDLESLTTIFFLTMILGNETILKSDLFHLYSHFEKTLIANGYKSPFINKQNNIKLIHQQLIKVSISGYYKINKTYIPENLYKEMFFVPEMSSLSLTGYNRQEDTEYHKILYDYAREQRTTPTEACFMFILFEKEREVTREEFNTELDALRFYMNSPTIYLYLKFSINSPFISSYENKITHDYVTKEEYESILQQIKVYYLYTKLDISSMSFTEIVSLSISENYEIEMD